jgi:hypothetical protein
LEEQIQLLHSADVTKSDQLDYIQSNASKAINTLLKLEKENHNLKSELSGSME